MEVIKSDLELNYHRTLCAAISVDKSRSSSGESVSLAGSLSHIKQVIGSNYSDVIIGNDLPNILNGGLGSDNIQGGNGADIYIVEENSGSKTIDNYASDLEEDLLVIGIPYTDIAVEKVQLNLVLFSSNNRKDNEVSLTSWFSGQTWQHLVFTSVDYVRFAVEEDDMGVVKKHPLTIDLSENQYGVRLDLLQPESSINITISSEVADEVKTVQDSLHNDNLIGNNLGNFLTCSGHSDYLQGNGGQIHMS